MQVGETGSAHYGKERFFASIRALLQTSDGEMTYPECTPEALPRDPSGKSEGRRRTVDRLAAAANGLSDRKP